MTGWAIEIARIVGGLLPTFPGGASPVKTAPRRRPDGCGSRPPPARRVADGVSADVCPTRQLDALYFTRQL